MKPTASMITCQALGLAPLGEPQAPGAVCSCCGETLTSEDKGMRLVLSKAFMDDLSLAARGSGITCGYCAAVMTAQALRDTQNGVFSAEGKRPFKKWVDVVASLREPPAPPFTMTFATNQNQHLAWRAPVNLSRDLFYVRMGLRDLKIRRHKLLAAVDAAVRLGQRMAIEPNDSSLSHPFAGLSPDLKDPQHAALRFKGPTGITLDEAAADLPADLALLESLTLGETWGLRFLLSPNAGQKPPAA